MADESSVYATLIADSTFSGLVSSRLWDQRIPESVSTPIDDPYVIAQVISSVPENHLSESPPCDQYRIQFNIYAKTKAQCKAVLTAIRNVLNLIGYEAFTQDFVDEETDLRRILVDFDIFITR